MNKSLLIEDPPSTVYAILPLNIMLHSFTYILYVTSVVPYIYYAIHFLYMLCFAYIYYSLLPIYAILYPIPIHAISMPMYTILFLSVAYVY